MTTSLKAGPASLTSKPPEAPGSTLSLHRPVSRHDGSPGVAPHFVTAAFEGPLELLLQLIRANRVEIYNIPIAEITEQYLAALERMEDLDLGVAGEYVLIAATLIEIKSRMLLPQPQLDETDGDAEDPRAELVARLLEYQQFQAPVETLRTWEAERRAIFFREAMDVASDYMLPLAQGEVEVSQLFQALHRLLSDAGVDEAPVTAVTPRKRLSLRMKMMEVVRRLARAGESGVPFSSLFELPCARYEIVLTFLALLELLKLGKARATQLEIHDEILVFAYSRDEIAGVR